VRERRRNADLPLWTERIPKRDKGFHRGIDCRTVTPGEVGACGRITERGRRTDWE